MSGTWWLWSAHTEVLIIIFGVFSVWLSLFLFNRMDREAQEHAPYTLGLKPIFYLPYILWEIIKANFDVAKIILHPKLPISPRMIRVEASQKTIVGQVIYANSITLTPGTITLDVRDGEFIVHALTKDTAAGVQSGEMCRRVSRMEGDS